jgi:hypothetical protein
MMQETDHVREKKFSAVKVGAGGVMTSFWEDGSTVLKWDGKHAVDVNMVTSVVEDNARRMRHEFQKVFTGSIEYMAMLAQDEHPRGYGAIVNFPCEIATPPHWVL